jgi:hypothetical protein
MADIKFTCPHCQQGIECDQLWCGHEINCPTCQAGITVPHVEAAPAAAKPLVPKPPSGPTPRLSAGKTQVARSVTPTGVPQKAFQRPVEKKSLSPLIKYALVGVGVAALGMGGFYVYPIVKDKFNKTSEAAANRPVGGEVGAAMDVNDTLDGVQPSRPARSLKSDVNNRINRRRVPGVQAAGDSAAALDEGASAGGSGAAAASPDKNLPVVAPVHTLDLSGVKIPVSKVNGTISGGSFVADKARIDKKPANVYALTLRQGAGLTPDRAIQVYLHFKGTDGPTNQTFTVSPGASDPAVSRVVKLWKTSAGFAPNDLSFSANYALKLELGSMDKGLISGKIFLALPDTDKTVVAGQFTAPLIIPDPSAQVGPAGFRPPVGASAAAARDRYNRPRRQ